MENQFNSSNEELNKHTLESLKNEMDFLELEERLEMVQLSLSSAGDLACANGSCGKG